MICHADQGYDHEIVIERGDTDPFFKPKSAKQAHEPKPVSRNIDSVSHDK